MRITFVTRKFGNVERNSHCDVLHITPIRVARLVLDCNGVFAMKAYTPLVQSSLHDLFGSLRHSCPSYMCSFRILSLHVKVCIIISLLISTVLNINVIYNMCVECFLPFSSDCLFLQILFSSTTPAAEKCLLSLSFCLVSFFEGFTLFSPFAAIFLCGAPDLTKTLPFLSVSAHSSLIVHTHVLYDSVLPSHPEPSLIGAFPSYCFCNCPDVFCFISSYHVPEPFQPSPSHDHRNWVHLCFPQDHLISPMFP